MWVLSCPQTVCENVNDILAEFGLSGSWKSQPLIPSSHQVQIDCDLSHASVADLASALSGTGVSAEIEIIGADSQRLLIHPNLGIHSQAIDSMGEPVLRGTQVSAMLARSNGNLAEFERHMRLATGQAWLDLLDPLRVPLEGVTYLPRAV